MVISEEDKRKLKKNAILFSTTGSLIGISLAAGVVTIPLAILAGSYFFLAGIEGFKSVDPPQLNYKHTVNIRKLNFTLDIEISSSLNALINNILNVASYSESHLDCVEKFQGAKTAEDENFSKKLSHQCKKYQKSYECELKKYSKLLNSVVNEIQNTEHDILITPDQFLKNRRNLVKKGLPDSFYQILFNAGFDRFLIDYFYHRMTSNRSKPKKAFTISDVLRKTLKIEFLNA